MLTSTCATSLSATRTRGFVKGSVDMVLYAEWGP
jgi:hypothetical protein